MIELLMKRIEFVENNKALFGEIYNHCLGVAQAKVVHDPEQCEIGPGDFVLSRYNQLYKHGMDEARGRLAPLLFQEENSQGLVEMLANDIGGACAETEIRNALPSWERIRLENLRDESEGDIPNPNE